jgi:choline kinase
MVASLRQAGLADITIVRSDPRVEVDGCDHIDLVGPGNMVRSLMAASEAARACDDLIVCYSDLVIEHRLLADLVRPPIDDAACYVGVDSQWELYYRWRFDGDVGDAESLEISEQSIVDIGRPLDSLMPMPNGQYIGLLRFSAEGFRGLTHAWDRLADPEIYMTDALREMIANGYRAVPIWLSGGWLELDSMDDYRGAVEVLTHADRLPFFDPGGLL